MKLRSFPSYCFPGLLGLFLCISLGPLYAQVTLSTSPKVPYPNTESSQPGGNPFNNSPSPTDSASVSNSTELTGPVAPSYSPSIPFPSGLADAIFGYDAPSNKLFNCYTVIFGIAGYQNAQAQGSCYEAQTACLRFGLLQQFLHADKRKQLAFKYPGSTFSREELESMLGDSLKDVKLKLVGCAVAIAASTITDSVIEQAGYPPPPKSQEEATQNR